jgi:hypothetical protein
MTLFTFRPHQRYKIEIRLGLYQCLISNATVARQMQGFGFHDVSVSGSGRNRIAQGAWTYDDATITVRKIRGTIDRSESKYPLAALLEAIGNAEELQPPKEIPSKRLAKGNTKGRRKRGKS